LFYYCQALGAIVRPLYIYTPRGNEEASTPKVIQTKDLSIVSSGIEIVKNPGLLANPTQATFIKKLTSGSLTDLKRLRKVVLFHFE
jgi:hypothetical protein